MSRNKQVNQVKDPFLSSCWKGIRSLRRASAIYQLYNQTIPNLILEKRTFQTIQLPWHRQKSVSVLNRTYSVHRVLRPRGTDRKFSSFDFEAAARYCQLFNVHIVPLWISRETVVDYCIRSGAVMSICIMHRLNKRVAVPSNVVEHGNRGSARRKTTIDSQILHTVHVHISSSIVQHIQINAPSSFFSFLSTLSRQPVIVHARLDHELRKCFTTIMRPPTASLRMTDTSGRLSLRINWNPNCNDRARFGLRFDGLRYIRRDQFRGLTTLDAIIDEVNRDSTLHRILIPNRRFYLPSSRWSLWNVETICEL